MRVLGAALLSAVLVVLWGSVSWLVLNWRTDELQAFRSESEVGRVLATNAPTPGLYLLPNSPGNGTDWKAAGERMRAGPFVVAMVRPGRLENWSFARLLGATLLNQWAAALLMILLLRSVAVESYARRVFFCMGLGLLSGLLGAVPNAIWWEYPWSYTLAAVADLMIAWFLAGIVIARVTRPVGWTDMD